MKKLENILNLRQKFEQILSEISYPFYFLKLGGEDGKIY